MLEQGVDISEFVIVKGQVGFHRSVLQKFVARMLIVLLLQVGQAHVEVHESQHGIGLRRSLEIGQSQIILLKIQMRLPHE